MVVVVARHLIMVVFRNTGYGFLFWWLVPVTRSSTEICSFPGCLSYALYSVQVHRTSKQCTDYVYIQTMFTSWYLITRDMYSVWWKMGHSRYSDQSV